MRFLRWITVVVSFTTSAHSSAGPETMRELPLSKILELAVERSSTLKAEAAHVAAEKERTTQSTTWQNPSLALAGGLIANDTGRGPIFEGTLYQSIPFPGKLEARERAAEAGARLAELGHVLTRLKVQAEAFAMTYALAASHRLTAHIEERQRRFRLIRAMLASRSNAVPALRAEKQIIENRLTLLEDHLLQKRHQQKQNWLTLNRYVQETTEFVPQVAWWQEPSVDTLRNALSSTTPAPELARQRIVEERAAAELEVGRKALWPDLQVGLGYRNERTDTTTHFYTGYLNLSIPLLDRGQHSVEALRHQLEAEKMRSAARLFESKQRLESLLLDVERGCATARLYPLSSLDELDRRFSEAESEFRRGRLPITLFLELEAQSHELQDRVFESQSELATALAQLSLHLGRLVAPEEIGHAAR
jgi:hypothetical protein